MRAAITRRYRFSASHRLNAPELSDAENARLYGKCNNPFGHGHDYELQVTAFGEVDERTGRILPLAKLDQLVEEKILRLFSHRNINLDLPQFERLVPTTENIVLVIADLLERNWNAYLGQTSARLSRVHIQETGRNGFELLLGTPEGTAKHETHSERLFVNA
jgi:6-pyruvoyltetrahydropterin/6-carboxytetrahydropterin synthase